MWALYKKEINSFLTSVTGFVVVGIFLVVTSLFLWVLPSGMNVFENGYANLDGYFSLAPYVFLFLVPAVSMRSFSEEKKSGTIELLLTRPVSDLKIILAKYFAAFSLVVLALVPTLVYYFSVYQLGYPVGNIDSGAFWGSFIGLLFLGAMFVSIGIFISSLTDNQIVSFLITVLVSAFLYMGFEFVYPLFGNWGYWVEMLGISAHYTSMSRGVIDSRDLIYFLSLIIFFIYLTNFNLFRRKW